MLGNATTVLAIFASPGLEVSTACTAGWPRRLVDPRRARVSFGPKRRAAQLAVWNGVLTDDRPPSLPARRPAKAKGSQLVGLIANPGRSRLTRTNLVRRGTPSTIWGRASELALT